MNTKILSICILLALPNFIFAQNDAEKAPELDPNAFVLLEKEPVILNLDEVKASIAYPEAIKGKETKGRVIVRILIDNKGNYVKHIVLKSPDSNLTKAVTANIHRLKCSPGIQDKQPIASWMTIPFDFVLRPASETNEIRKATIEGQENLEGGSIELDSYPFATNLQEIVDRIGFPTAAKNKGIEGTCEVSILVGTNGKYLEHIVNGSPHPIFKNEVEKQLPYLKFEPAMRDYKPVRCWVTIPFQFYFTD